MRSALKFLVIATLVGVTAGRAMAGTNNPAFQPPDESLIPQGRFVYERNCAVCHGKYGDGRGDMGLTVKPRPRNFNKAVFKFRSTPPGFLPTDDDLVHTIRQGLSGTAMPSFQNLSDRDVTAVAQYVKSFSAKWNKPANFSPPIPLPDQPAWFDQPKEASAQADHGRLLYLQACAACHGDRGDGRGPSAATLVDAWDEPAPPTDLREPVVRSGPGRRDAFRALTTGLDGTPMPEFRETFSEEQRWQLVAYLEQLRKDYKSKDEKPGR
ncbi:MAG: c-type cytochrome [Akkermansiaceae bacterium]|nr:c-type cytochrome [Verrucomicrobiales bacterium]